MATEIEKVVRAAEALADAAEDMLYVEEDTEGEHREALIATWRQFCAVMDHASTNPEIAAAQDAYFKDRDAPITERELVEERVRIVNTTDGLRQQTERVYKQREV